MLSSLEIAQAAVMRPIADVAAEAGIEPDELELYGRYKAKVDLSILDRLADVPDAKLVNVTAITPTPPGEGKTTTSVSLAQGFGKIGRRAILALREPSLGPVFGVKGGAAGGGYAQVVPMEDINLHFTGDMHAITAANNLLSALVDAHRFHRHEPEIATVTWRRAIDVTDRQLRNIVGGLGGAKNGVPAESGFDITAASEVMAILALATDLPDLRRKLGAITVGYTPDGDPVTAEEIKAAGAMAVLLKDALKPNIVQTLEGQLCFMHAGPFANIAHGNNSIIADRIALKLGEFVITESGFAADLGMEKFMDIVCRVGGLRPHVVVIVATVRALRHHGGGDWREKAAYGADGGRGRDRDGEPRQAHRERARVRDPAGRRDQHAARRRARAARADQGALARGRRVRRRDPQRLRRRAARARPSSPRSSPLRPRPSPTSACSTRTTSRSRRRSRRSRRRSTARTGSISPPAAREAIARYREAGPRAPADLHGEDPPLALARSGCSATGPRGSSSRFATSGSTPARACSCPLCGDMLQMPGLGAQPAAFAIDIDENGETVGLF